MVEKYFDYADTVEVHNPTDEVVVIWWGSDTYYFNPKSTVKIPRLIARASLSHESYKMLVIHEQANEEKAKQGNELPETENQSPEGRPEGPQGVLEPWKNPEWNPMECDYGECLRYITTYNLKIAEHIPSDAIRNIVDEHFMSTLG